MSVSGISNTGFNFALLNHTGASKAANASAMDRAAAQSPGSFSASLSLLVANLQSQTFGMLLGSGVGANKADNSTGIDALLTSLKASSAPQSLLTPADSLSGISATGRNLGLFNPESAYRMMSLINNNDVAYKSQFSELSQMKSYLVEMQKDGERLGGITASADNADIQSQLKTFAVQYNDWVQRFDVDMQKGSVLAGTQAAQVSRYELDQSVKNVFNGASDGLHGLASLGFTIDPNTKLAVLDIAKLDAVLVSNKPGAVNTLQEFGANFAKSAALLNSAGNLIPNRLDNLDRVIHYFADHKASLQAEFGLGDTPKPSGQVAQALAAYNQQNYFGV